MSKSSQDLSVFLRCLQDVCFPLIAAVLKESLSKGQEKKSSGHGAKDGDVGREAGVADSAVMALGSAAKLLQWPQYEGLLLRFLKLMKESGGASKPLVRAFCSVLDSFHFTSPRDAFEQEPPPPLPPTVQEEEAEDNDVQMTDAEDLDKTKATSASIHQVLVSRVLPCLQSHIVEEDEEGVRSPVALALIKLLRLLPPDVERTELPRALRSVCNLLKNRQQKVRDDVRSVLVVLASELGPRYMPYMLQVLRSSLPNRGYTSHVVGYVAHAVIDSVVTARLRPESKSSKKKRSQEEAATASAAATNTSAAPPPAPTDKDEEEDVWGDEGAPDRSLCGFLDESLELALPLIEEELFGEVSEAKDVVAFTAAYKEAKRVRGYETYRLLASAITLGTHLDLLLSLVRDKLHLASSPTVKNKLSQLLQFAARGVRENPTAAAEPLMIWVHGALKEGLAADEWERERAEGQAGAASRQHDERKKKYMTPKGESSLFAQLLKSVNSYPTNLNDPPFFS